MSARILINQSATKKLPSEIGRSELDRISTELSALAPGELDERSVSMVGTDDAIDSASSSWRTVPVLDGTYWVVIRQLTRDEAVRYAGATPDEADNPVYLVSSIAQARLVQPA